MRRPFLLWYFCVLIMSVTHSAAQSVVNAQTGKRAYDRFLETQQEYNSAVARGADSLEIAELCYLMGKRYEGLVNYHRARQWFTRALKIWEPLGPSESVGKVYLWMTDCEYSQGERGNPDSIMRFASKALYNFERAGARERMVGGYRGMAGAHQFAWERRNTNPAKTFVPSLDSAFRYSEKALALAIAIPMPPKDIALTYFCTSGYWQVRKEFTTAIGFQTMAMTIYRKEKDWRNIVDLAFSICTSYMGLRQPVEARKWLGEGLRISKALKVHSHKELRRIEEIQADYYSYMGDWKKAYAHRQRANAFNLYEVNAYRDGAFDGLRAQYENESKEIKLRANEQEVRMQRELNIVTLLLALMGGISAVLFFRLFIIYKKRSTVNEGLVREQSHRFNNGLQSVFTLLSSERQKLSDPVAIEALEESLRRLDALSHVHRQLYEGGKLARVQVDEYIPDIVEGTLRSYNLTGVAIEYLIDDLLLDANKAIPLGLILNELVTNACKYAFTGNPAPMLRIACRRHGDHIRFSFADNGINPARPRRHGSFGLDLIGQMLENLKAEGGFDGEGYRSFTFRFDTRTQRELQTAHQTL
ncbi:Two-component sensor histidine kinase, contains HisKA and HATPase domains [Dyadobacter sp. SG02]|uniref:sensor histidine kinase n=1 Tax=Dyadobacter sp. SG02 TaxID=1855291 RepID=UPI0008C1265C|nr:sensor histidine kinase [Dyadobacter sp. SG02]SEI40268.1 Two-component sensor histidine kinase, contains HisKA and HATPase domains [Dyadobacter sp. SG02]